MAMTYSREQVSDSALLRNAAEHHKRERTALAEFLADIAEIDSRRLYVPAGYPSMFAFCMGEYGLSEDAAYKRIQAARKAREIPSIFQAVADGRLNLSGLSRLVPYLSFGKSDELLALSSGLTNSAIEALIASRFPRTEALPMIEAESTPRIDPRAVPATVNPSAPDELAARQVEVETAARAPQPIHPRSRVEPIAVDRFTVHVSVDASVRDKLH
jgi:hypothetical protein